MDSNDRDRISEAQDELSKMVYIFFYIEKDLFYLHFSFKDISVKLLYSLVYVKLWWIPF